MSVRSAQSITTTFTTAVFSTGAAANADSLPTGTLYVNGVADAATVTVTNITTGLYKAAVTLPALAVGDVVSIVIAATVSSVAGKGKVWEDSKDVLLDSSGKVTDNLQTGDSFARIGVAGVGLTNVVLPSGGLANVTAWSVAITGNVTGNLSGSVGSVTGLTASDVGAIKTKTDNLPSDPADASDIAALFTTLPAAVRDVSNSSPAAGSLGEACRNADAKAANIQIKTDQLTFNGSGNVNACAGGTDFVQTAGKVWALDGSGNAILPASSYTAPPTADANAAATAVQITTDHGSGSYAGSGGLDAAGVRAALGMAAADLDDQLDAIAGDVGALGSATIEYVGPMNPVTGEMTLIRGDDYTAANGRTLGPWAVSVGDGFPDLTGATVRAYWHLSVGRPAIIDVDATVANPGTNSQSLSLGDLVADDTAKLGGSRFAVAFIATLADESIDTIMRQVCNVQAPEQV